MTGPLMLVYGLPGSGKSTLCTKVVARLPATVLLSSAELRRSPRFAGRLLDPAARAEILAILAERADSELAASACTIVDTNCMDVPSRAAFISVAARHGAAVVLVKCVAESSDIMARMRHKPESAITPLPDWRRFVDDRLVDPDATERSAFAALVIYNSATTRTGPAVIVEQTSKIGGGVRRLLGAVVGVAASL